MWPELTGCRLIGIPKPVLREPVTNAVHSRLSPLIRMTGSECTIGQLTARSCQSDASTFSPKAVISRPERGFVANAAGIREHDSRSVRERHVVEAGGSDPVDGARSGAPGIAPISSPTSVVFISYASQDAAVAEALCAALEREGIACWIAPRNVRPGDFYADAIVRGINACPVLVLVLSQAAIDSPHVLREVERASAKKHTVITFRLDAAALPPGLEYFLSASQWIDSGGKNTDRLFPNLIDAVRGRMAPQPKADPESRSLSRRAPKQHSSRLVLPMAVVVALALAYLVADKFWLSRHARTAPQAATPSSLAQANLLPPTSGGTDSAFAPPAHSIAVLPFVNMSGDPKQDYFSDGISEELLNALSQLNDLQVIARTSSFSFKGQDLDVSAIARKLNVGSILEGSVRRAGNTVRITAQLINTVTGFHLWSQTYDRNLTDILKVQSEVATSVAQQLEAKLVANEANKMDVGGTKNAEAYDIYLQGSQLLVTTESGEARYRAALALFDQAIVLDPNYAAAYTKRAFTLVCIRAASVNLENRKHEAEEAMAAAQHAIALAPGFAEAHLTLAIVLDGGFDFTGAAREYDRALALAPGSARVQGLFSLSAAAMGHFAPAITAAERSVSLDPQSFWHHLFLARVLNRARRYGDALTAFKEAQALNPASHMIEAEIIIDNVLASGQIEQARQQCESPSALLNEDDRHQCLALAYHASGRQADAEREFAEYRALGDSMAYQYAGIYAQWGDNVEALQWLSKAERLRDPGLVDMKVDWQLDPIRNEPQFKAIEARMRFPP
jgi:TolB-like protein/Flp pilus assembly protein TadD